MIVVDTSALIALLFGEPEARQFGSVIQNAGKAALAAPTAFEFVMVAQGRKGRALSAHRLLDRLELGIMAWTHEHMQLASDAFVRFGKGQGHPAQLNFGDCMAYALAKSPDAPLLYKGDDFAQTDIRSAL